MVFYYGLLWSRELTWGGESKPRKGDTVYVAENQVLIVDESSPVFLNAMISEGIVIFADNIDITLDVWMFITRFGRVIAGTE